MNDILAKKQTTKETILQRRSSQYICDKYALKTIKNEALKEEIEDFITYYRISPKRVYKMLASL